MSIYIFDFDGTLVDSMRQWGEKMTNVLDTHGISYPSDIIKTITPLGDRGTAEYFIKNLGLDMTVNEILELMDSCALKVYADEIPAKEGVSETLSTLKARGHSLNVLTASPHRMLDVCLKRIGIFSLFDNVWSCDDFNATKSDPNIYKEAAKLLGTVPPDCIFADDNINACRTAKLTGMKVIGVFDESSADCVPEMKQLCDRYIYKFKELL